MQGQPVCLPNKKQKRGRKVERTHTQGQSPTRKHLDGLAGTKRKKYYNNKHSYDIPYRPTEF